VKAKVSDFDFSIFSVIYSEPPSSRTVGSLSSAEWGLHAARRISRTSFSAGTRAGGADDFWLIFTLLWVR